MAVFIKYIIVEFGITGLTPQLNIIDVAADNKIVGPVSMAELVSVPKVYKYEYVTLDPTKHLLFSIDGGVTLQNEDRYPKAVNETGYIEDKVQNIEMNTRQDINIAGH